MSENPKYGVLSARRNSRPRNPAQCPYSQAKVRGSNKSRDGPERQWADVRDREILLDSRSLSQPALRRVPSDSMLSLLMKWGGM